MPLRNSQYDAIMREYNRKQLHSKREQEERHERVYQEIPRLAAISEEISSLSLKKARSLLGEGEDSNFDLPLAIAELARQRRELLISHGYPPDYLKSHYSCSHCMDTGYVDNEKCICFKKAATELLYTQSNIRTILEEENFENFTFDYYPDDIPNHATGLTALGTAHRAVDIAWNFIETFDETFQNIFIYGDTGVGKTYLSHCIAKELIDRACCTLYFSSFDLFEELSKSHFSRNDDKENMASYIMDCDLLIIDDLGTELINNFVASQLFFCVNERIMHRKSTIISTNLSLDKFKSNYSERTFSRISSNYKIIKLFGNDIRIHKTLSGGK